MLFDWYTDGDTPSQVFDGSRLSEPSARVFDAIAARVGGDCRGAQHLRALQPLGRRWSSPDGATLRPQPPPAPEISESQTLVTSGIENAIAAARAVAGDKDVCLMGGGLVTEALTRIPQEPA